MMSRHAENHKIEIRNYLLGSVKYFVHHFIACCISKQLSNIEWEQEPETIK